MQRIAGTLRVIVTMLLAASFVVMVSAPASAANGDCGQPSSNGKDPTSSDCLYTLRAAVGLEDCLPECICDTDGDEEIVATDALLCLRYVVGAETDLACDCPGGSSTTSTTAAPTTTAPGSTTTLSVTTSTVTTTTLPSSQCPVVVDVHVLAGAGATCATNTDCASGLCSEPDGRCSSTTDLDVGWTGEAHDADLNETTLTLAIACPGDAPACGQCAIFGAAASGRTCRCQGDHRRICDAPFAPDLNDCAGGPCLCYLGPPLPLLAGNTPVCVVNRLTRAIAGTIDPDAGALDLDLDVRADIYSGAATLAPCPSCGGRCTEPAERLNHACITNADCDFEALPGLCEQYDTVAGDGVREGLCFGGPDEGFACDASGFNSSFPAPGGAATSLDCFPSSAQMQSGDGLAIRLQPSTGSQSLDADVPCGFQPGLPRLCPCGVCSGSTGIPCSSDADCTAPATCAAPSGTALPNACSDEVCSVGDLEEGACAAGPFDLYCDELVRPGGGGLIRCQSNTDCAGASIGLEAGACTLSQPRDCLPPALSSEGQPDAQRPLAAGLFCVPPTANSALNTVFGLPGPARVRMQTALASFCGANRVRSYVPGVGCE